MKSIPTVDPLTSSRIPATEKITENMIMVATRAIRVSSPTMAPEAFTTECFREM